MNNNSLGPLLVRLGVGIVMVIHGAGKLFSVGPAASSIADITGFIASLGFPAASLFAWLVAIVEFGGGLLVLFGLFTRYAALAIAINMLVATVLVHLPKGYLKSEITLVLFLAALSLVASGAGKLSVAQIVFDREISWPASTLS
jgi:putative oxidoreductase